VRVATTPGQWEREKDLCRIWFQSGLTDEDRDWLREHLELAGSEVPSYDISWIELEWTRW